MVPAPKAMREINAGQYVRISATCMTTKSAVTVIAERQAPQVRLKPSNKTPRNKNSSNGGNMHTQRMVKARRVQPGAARDVVRGPKVWWGVGGNRLNKMKR